MADDCRLEGDQPKLISKVLRRYYTILRTGEISFETLEEAKKTRIEKEMFTGITTMKK